MAFINVKDTGPAQVATNVVSYAGDTVETQIINICDPSTPANQLAIDSTGRARTKPPMASTYLSYSVSAGIAATQIVSSSTSNLKVTIQNFSEAATNATVYLGGSTVSTSTGIALLDGNSRTFENTAALYAIVVSTTTSVRVLVETGS